MGIHGELCIGIGHNQNLLKYSLAAVTTLGAKINVAVIVGIAINA